MNNLPFWTLVEAVTTASNKNENNAACWTNFTSDTVEPEVDDDVIVVAPPFDAIDNRPQRSNRELLLQVTVCRYIVAGHDELLRSRSIDNTSDSRRQLQTTFNSWIIQLHCREQYFIHLFKTSSRYMK